MRKNNKEKGEAGEPRPVLFDNDEDEEFDGPGWIDYDEWLAGI